MDPLKYGIIGGKQGMEVNKEWEQLILKGLIFSINIFALFIMYVLYVM